MKTINPPLPLGQTLSASDMDAKGWVKGVIAVDLSSLIDSDLESFLDLISVKLVGNELLMDARYRVVGHDGNTLHLAVEGDASEAFKE